MQFKLQLFYIGRFNIMRQKILLTGKVIIGSFLFLSALSLNAQAQQVISLQKAVDLTLSNNLTIKQAKITEALGTEDVKQSKNNMLPSVTVNPQGSYNFVRSPNLTTYSYTSQ
mgnify:CR=1 FL=1